MTLELRDVFALCEQFAALHDGALEPAQMAQLEERLNADREVRRLYVRYMRICAGLAWDFSDGAEPAEAVAEDAVAEDTAVGSTPAILLESEDDFSVQISVFSGAGIAPPSSGQHSHKRGEGEAVQPSPVPTADGPLPTADVPQPPASPVLGFLGEVVAYVARSRTLMFWLIAATICGWFVFQAGSVIIGRFRTDHSELANQAGPGPARIAEEANPIDVHSGKIVARLTNAIDCEWLFPRRQGVKAAAGAAELLDAATLALGADLPAGQLLNLKDGLAEITFESGAKIILHGPSRFTIGDARGGDLHLGRLTAKVPHTAVGFTVSTPSGKVVDLGTEFGVAVTAARLTEVVVFVGQVAVSTGSGSSSGNGGGELTSTVRVSAGQAVRVAPGQPLASAPANVVGFVRDLAPLGNGAAAEKAYVEFVKSLKPAVWFRMEGKDSERVIHDETGLIRDGVLSWDGPGNPFVKGRIGKGLWLRGAKLGDHAYVSDYPKAEHGKLTVSAWAYADTRNAEATIAANWRANFAAGQFQLALFSDGPGDTANLSVRITANDGKFFNEVAEGKAHPFPLYEWQHVAFTTDGTTLRLYRQGREVGSLKHAGLRYPSPIPSLAIGCTFDQSDRKPGNPPGYWDGKLDEVMIFNDALSAEQIQKLAAAAPR
jgi:hypothetical protein